jgi:hypothetical protein
VLLILTESSDEDEMIGSVEAMLLLATGKANGHDAPQRTT